MVAEILFKRVGQAIATIPFSDHSGMKHPKTGKAAKKTGKSGDLGSPAVPEQQVQQLTHYPNSTKVADFVTFGRHNWRSRQTSSSVHMQKAQANVLPLPRHAKEVQSLWDQLSVGQQTELLTFDLRMLYARAHYTKGK